MISCHKNTRVTRERESSSKSPTTRHHRTTLVDDDDTARRVVHQRNYHPSMELRAATFNVCEGIFIEQKISLLFFFMRIFLSSPGMIDISRRAKIEFSLRGQSHFNMCNRRTSIKTEFIDRRRENLRKILFIISFSLLNSFFLFPTANRAPICRVGY